uniref:Uncharacterized protein n=1 Tax=Oryzias melastigma TaxID=30732 RepID=A0A3B3DKJ2_ORYME
MREVVLALCLALVAPDFSTGKTYVYKYEVSIMNSLPDEGLARAGLNLSCKFLISALDQDTYTLKLVDPKMSEFNGIWPKDRTEPVENIPEALEPEFQIPIKFEYKNGAVGKVYAPEQFSDLLLNFYRGFLSILQLNIKKTHNVYDLHEAGIEGVCRSLYSVNEDLRAERIFLTKTRDMNHCQERIYRDMGMAYTEKCDECQKKSKTLIGSASYTYVLKQVPSGIMILEADVNELIQFSPLSERHGAAQTETKQTLVFLEIQNSPIKPISAEYHHRGSLKYEFSNEFEWTPLQLVNIKDLQGQTAEILNHLVTQNAEKLNDQAPLKYLELTHLLRLALYEDLEVLWNKYKNLPSHRLWLLEAVSASGTSAALRFIKEKFVAEDLSVVEAVRTLAAAVHMVTARSESINLFETLMEDNKINANPVLREIVFLGYGTLISKYCAESDVCPIEYIKKHLSEAVSKGETEDIILYVKVLGNAGHPSSLKSITKIMPIHGTAAASLPIRVHIEAIMALRNIAKKEPRMVQELALQLYMDKALDPELRMLSCIVLFETNPSMALVSTLANAVKSEENLQVASFTYSHMKSLSRSASIIHPSVAAACNVAMKILSPKLDRLSLRYSKAVYGEAYSSSFMLGSAATAFYINDAATFLPRSLVAKTKAFFAGAAVDVLEIGVRTDGLQETLLKNPSSLNSADRITKMKRVIKALSHWKSLPNNKPLVSCYVKLFGQEIAFANIDKPMIEWAIALASGPSLQKYGIKALKTLLLSGVSFNYTMPVMITEIRRILPTTSGISLELSFYSAAVAAAAVKVKPTLTPRLPEDFPLSRLLETDIELETEIRPSFAMDTYAIMGTNSPLYHAFIMSRAKINSTLPSKISAKLHIKEGDFKIEALPDSAPENITAGSVETFAVIRNVLDPTAERITPILPYKVMRSSTSQNFSNKESSENFQEDVKQKVPLLAKRYCTKYRAIGLKACFKVATENAAFIHDTALYRMIGSQNASFSITPIEGEAVERLEMEVKVGAKAAEKIIKQINLNDGAATVLSKLNKILALNKNHTSSSSSSSSRSSSSKHSSKSSSSSSISSSHHSSSSSHTSSSSRLTSTMSFSNSARSSSASSLASLLSAESSSSRDSARRSMVEIEKLFHCNKQLLHNNVATNPMLKRKTFVFPQQKNKFLDERDAAVVVSVRAVRANQKDLGYQVVVYVDKPNARLQIILSPLSESNWKLCADGVWLSKHKITAKLAWGAECKEYSTMITGETGLVSSSPATRLRLSWEKLPSYVKLYGEKVYDYMPNKMLADLIKAKRANSTRQLSFTVVAKSEKTVELIAKTPQHTSYNMTLHLPITLPLQELKTLTPFEEVIDKVHYVFVKVVAAECSFYNNTLRTFNNRRYMNKMPESCYQVLTQDCTEELKFMVLQMKDSTRQNRFNVKIADIDIDLYPKESEVYVKVNGMVIPLTSLPYQHPTASIEIRESEEGVSVYAAGHGLHEVYVNKTSWRIKIADWMKGKTCGLCGKADGEVRQDYRSPNGRLAKNSVSFALSWILPAESCKDNTECRMKYESIQLEKNVNVHGQDSTCFSVEPVLRCLPGCSPVKTTAVNVGFKYSTWDPSNIFDSSVDLRDSTEAHLACSCTAQCS